MTLHAHRPRFAYQDFAIPTLETERLVLRAPRLHDAEDVALLLNDRRIAENSTRIPHPYTRADAKEWLSICNRCDGEATFLITLPDDTIVGACGVGPVDDGAATELGYWIGAPFWGQGFATEAVRAVVDHAFTDMELDVLRAGTRVSNPASRRVLEKCGFQWTCVGLYRIPAMGSSAPIDRFRLERRIWASLKSWTPMRRVA